MSQIRGLAQFIADVRAASTPEAEKTRVFNEVSTLRKKIRKTNKPSGYELRKFLSKLIFVHLLGYEVDFGSAQTEMLLALPHFPEKHIAYLALGLLPQRPPDFEEQVVSDLKSPHEFLTALALNYISTDLALASKNVSLIYQLMVSPTSSAAVAKKAALTLCSLVKSEKFELENAEERILRSAAMLDAAQPGFALTLATFLCSCLTHNFASNLTSQIGHLTAKKLVSVFNSNDVDYKYGSVPCPWLLAKLLELLAYTKPQLDEEENDSLSELVNVCMQKNSTCLMVLLPAAMLAANLDLKGEQTQIMEFALELLSNQETYKLVGLQLLFYVGTPSDEICMEIRPFLKSKDAAVRTQALAVLGKLATTNSVEFIAADVLDLLAYAELGQRPKMANAVQELAKQFAFKPEFYLDTCLALLTTGSGDSLWQEIFSVVCANEPLQSYAIKRCCESLAFSQPSPGLVCLAACLVGKFSNLYQGDPLDLVAQLEDAREYASSLGVSMLISAYTQLAAKQPNVRPQVADLMDVYMLHEDLEIQTRALECLMLLRPENEGLLNTCLTIKPQPQMPAVNSNLQALKSVLPTTQPMQSGNLPTPISPQATMPAIANATPQTSSPQATSPPASKPSTLSSNWEFGFKRMLTQPSAVLYQDALLQIGCRYAFEGSCGKVSLYLKNISTYKLSALSLEVRSNMPTSTFQFECPKTTTSLAPNESETCVIKVQAKQPFAQPPIVHITYFAGTPNEINCKLPIVLERFMAPSLVTRDEFEMRWQQLELNEFTKQFINFSLSKSMTAEISDLEAITGMQYAIVSSTNSETLAAGIIHTEVPAGALLRLSKQGANYMVKVRATNKLVSVVLANNLASVYTL